METLFEKLNKQKEDIENQIKLFELYPDLSKYNGRWDSYYQSTLVNQLRNNFDIEYRTSCGCCADAVIYAMPYVEHKGVKVYTNPAQITIGEKNEYGSGIIEYENWVIKAKEQYKLSDEIIKSISMYLDENLPVNYDDEEDE
jgi:hypothetical protein